MRKGSHYSDEEKRQKSEDYKLRKICVGEKNPMFGKNHSEKTKEKISKSRQGKRMSPETKDKISKSLKLLSANGGWIAPEVRQRIAEFHRGRIRPPETRLKISKAMTGKHWPEERRKKRSEACKGENGSNWKGGITKKVGYWRVKAHRRRILKEMGGAFTIGEWENLKTAYGNTCPMCGRKEPDIILTIDHVVPLSKGGKNVIQNLQPLCRECNSKKRTKVFRIKSNGELTLF